MWEKEITDHKLHGYVCGIIPRLENGIITEDIIMSYDVHFRENTDLVEAQKFLIRHLVENIQRLQIANREKSAIWTQHRTNEDQIECGEDCPFGYFKEVGIHYHDVEKYSLEKC